MVAQHDDAPSKFDRSNDDPSGSEARGSTEVQGVAEQRAPQARSVLLWVAATLLLTLSIAFWIRQRAETPSVSSTLVSETEQATGLENSEAAASQPAQVSDPDGTTAARSIAGVPAAPTNAVDEDRNGPEALAAIDTLCERIGRKLSSVSKPECLRYPLIATGEESVDGAPLVLAEFAPLDGAVSAGGQARHVARSPRRGSAPRVLMLGGIHGDEYSSVTIMFKWMALLAEQPPTVLHWLLLPVLNPDGLLRPQSQRMNARGVDLNRNFPTPNWGRDATQYWVNKTGRNPRRYPGEAPLSEPESRFLQQQIERFQPDIIVAVHAPLEVVDFDGPREPPEQLGPLALRRMGTYPGSLGRYGGEHLGLPVVTIELPSAGTMPPRTEQERIWRDLGAYLQRTLSATQNQLAATPTGGA